MPPFIANHAGGLSLTLVVALVSFLSLVLGELVPKSLGLRYASDLRRVDRAGRAVALAGRATLRLVLDRVLERVPANVRRPHELQRERARPEDVLNVVGEAAERDDSPGGCGDLRARSSS